MSIITSIVEAKVIWIIERNDSFIVVKCVIVKDLIFIIQKLFPKLFHFTYRMLSNYTTNEIDPTLAS